MKKPDLPLTGGCSCGAVRYRIDAFPLLLYACHCTDCQRQSGSAFAMSMPVTTDAFHITEGAPQPWRRTSREAEVTSWFCGNCGGRIYGERSSRRQSINVRAGTLDDTTWLRPVAHLFMRSAQPWEQIADASICYEAMPDDFKEVAELWHRLWTS